MIKLSARMLYRGTDHTKLLFNGMLHDKMYKGGQLIWKRGLGKKYFIASGSPYDHIYKIYIDTKEYEDIRDDYWYISVTPSGKKIWRQYVFKLEQPLLCNSKMCFRPWIDKGVVGKYGKWDALGIFSDNGKQWNTFHFGYSENKYLEGGYVPDGATWWDNDNHFLIWYYAVINGKKFDYQYLFNLETKKFGEVSLLDPEKLNQYLVISDGTFIVYAYRGLKGGVTETGPLHIVYPRYINEDDLSKTTFTSIDHPVASSFDDIVAVITINDLINVLWNNNDDNDYLYRTTYRKTGEKVSQKRVLSRHVYANMGLYCNGKAYLYFNYYVYDYSNGISFVSVNCVMETEDGIDYKITELPEKVRVYDIINGKYIEKKVSQLISIYGDNITSESNCYFENDEMVENKGHLIVGSVYIDNLYFEESPNNLILQKVKESEV